MTPPRCVLIANPGTPRCEAFRQEWDSHWKGRGPELVVVPWGEIASCRGDLEFHPAFERPAVVRLDSPGKDANVYRQFLHVADPDGNWLECDYPKGLILRPGLWYRGFERILRGLQRSFDERPHLRPTAQPRDVAVMFDKHSTAIRLREAEVPVPEWADIPSTRPHGNWPTTYLKLRYGSSASGIVMMEIVNSTPRSESRIRSTTTMVEIDGRFFNSRQIRTVRGGEIHSAAIFLSREGAINQQAIPMAKIDGMNVDLRVVCLNGRPVAPIFRLSPHPMTNLHLGGIRGDFARCRATIPNRYWLDAMEHAEAAAAQFDSAVVGIDIVFERGSYRSFVLEVNAFGDFFPWWTDTTGRSLHALEIAAAFPQ